MRNRKKYQNSETISDRNMKKKFKNNVKITTEFFLENKFF